MAYIICERRKGNPKLSVEVCRRKCKFTDQCKPYGKYLSGVLSGVAQSTGDAGLLGQEEARKQAA